MDPSTRTPDPEPVWSEELVVHLVRRHQAGVRTYLVSLGCPPNRADDLVQETFLAFLDSGFEDRGAGSSFRFLRVVARNLFLKSIRSQRRLGARIDLDVVEETWSKFDPGDDGAEYLQALRDCLEQLSPRSREVFRLRYEEELSRAAIAARCDLGESGVHAALNRGRKSLRECVERRLG